MDSRIELRLTGEGIKPGTVRSQEIAELLEALEDLVTSQALLDNPQLNKDDIVVGLYEIADQSIGLRFKTTLASLVVPAFISATQAVAHDDFDSISPQSIKALQVVSAFTKRHHCLAEMKISERELPLATISPETIIPLPISIHGPTEVAGKVLRVGGKVPRAMIELLHGTVIYCDLPVELAKELGHRLYSTVIFHGMASWNSRTFELEEFSLSHIDEFPQRHPSEVMGELAQLIGSQFSPIRDVPEFVTNLRRDGEDQ